MSLQSWHHIVATYDGSKKSSGVKIYVDGRSLALDVPYDSLNGTLTNNAPLLIGGRIHALLFSGAVSDVRFYRRAMTAADVKGWALERAQQLAQLSEDKRSEVSRSWIKAFFRESEATDFLAATERVKAARRQKEYGGRKG